MSKKQKQEQIKNITRNIVIDQLLASEPATLSTETLLKGIQCSFEDYTLEDLLELLDELLNNKEVLKIFDVESGARFKLSIIPDKNFEEEDF